MGLFDWLFEGAVELPARKGLAGLERCIAEVRDAVARAKAAEDKVPRIVEGDSTKRYKSRIFFSSANVIQAGIRDARTFGQEVGYLVARYCDGRAAVCYKRAGLSRQTFSHAVSRPKSGVARETVLRIALGLQLSYERAVQLMAVAGYAFSASDATDAVFAYCLREKIYSIFDVNDLLVALGRPPLRID